MSTTVDRTQEGAPRQSAPEIVRVSVPKRSLASELRAIRIVWRRELIRFKSDRLRIVTSLVQPLLFLFVLGSGLQSIANAGTHGVDLKTFIYPGILCIAVMFTAMFSAASIVWDREFGFLREMMVAPVRRSSIVIGKCLGGATVASFQGVIVIALAGLGPSFRASASRSEDFPTPVSPTNSTNTPAPRRADAIDSLTISSSGSLTDQGKPLPFAPLTIRLGPASRCPTPAPAWPCLSS